MRSDGDDIGAGDSVDGDGGHGHFFSKKTFHRPTYCHHCTDMLWGLIGQGYLCEGQSYLAVTPCSRDLLTVRAPETISLWIRWFCHNVLRVHDVPKCVLIIWQSLLLLLLCTFCASVLTIDCSPSCNTQSVNWQHIYIAELLYGTTHHKK